MGMISGLFKSLWRPASGQRSWTADELRELIDGGQLEQARAGLAQLSPNTPQPAAERACLLGEIQFRERQDEAAAASFRDALRDVPGMAAAHHGLSLILAEQDRLEDAVLHAQFAAQIDPTNARYLAQVGYAHLKLKNYKAAEGPLRRATRLMADNPYLWNNLGIVLRAKDNAAEAELCFEQALRLRPDFAAAESHLQLLSDDIAGGRVSSAGPLDGLLASNGANQSADHGKLLPVLQAEARGDLQAAIDACETLELSLSDDARVSIMLARLYERVGESDSARDVLSAYLSRAPGEASVQGALGLVLLGLQQFSDAERWLDKALQQDARVDLLLGMAAALSGQERFGEAGPWIDRALEIQPGDLSIMAHRATNLGNCCRYEESLALIEEMNARGARVTDKAWVYGYLGRFDEALASLDEELMAQPRDPGLRLQRAAIALLLGRYREGWEDYAYRGQSAKRDFRMLPFPVWHGGPLVGQRIIVLAEQGLGDQIMFASCLPDLLALGPAKVVVEANRRVAATLARSFPDCEVLATGQDKGLDWVREHPDTDCFVHLGDLPRQFRREPSEFPRHQGYLHADPERVAYWRARLEACGPGPYIGISWRGGTETTRATLRSMTPEHFLPIARCRQASWVSLQYGEVAADVARAAAAGLPLQHWPEAISDLDEFAALIRALDLVITVCNTTVHYAGALGRPVWVLAPRIPEWRYGLDGEHMPWYPSSTMFRQRLDQNWLEPIEAVCQKLSTWTPAPPHDRALFAQA